MIDREPIPMPTTAQRDRAVAAILTQGLPPREPLGKRILRTARTLPPSVLFFGVGDCLFLAVLLALVCLPPAAWAVAQREALPSLLFLFSPALYALLQGLTQWKEGMSHTMEWKQACRISLPTLTAWRMLVFGGVAVVLCVTGNLLLWQLRGGQDSLLWMLALSFSSLFLYAALSLFCQGKGRKMGVLLPPLVWVAVGLFPLGWPPAEDWLLRVPAAVFLLLAAAGLGGFLWHAIRCSWPPTESIWKEAVIMLSVEHVTKRYGKFTALEDLSLTFAPGVYGLLAPNGAGKTTLIKMLTTLLFPTRGQILWDGEDIQALGETYRAQLGYLPQTFGYYPSYTPRQFLRYAAALQRIPPAEVEGRIADRLKQVGLEEVADQKMRKFSGGMLQRTGIALAILGDPKLLILDEPTAGLDPRERVRFRNLIHALAADRIVILSTHIVSDVETIAGQIILLRDHRLYCCASPAEICAPYQGKVFLLPAGTPLAHGQTLLSEGQGAEGTFLRVLCDRPLEGGVPAQPTLEDAFLAIYGEGQP